MPDAPDEDAWLEEIVGANDRAAAITICAFFEDALADAICSCLINISPAQYDRLFREIGPFATFYGKIEVGFALGLFGPNTKAILHNIRRIRNRFAHTPEAINFGDKKIYNWCVDIKNHLPRAAKNNPIDPRSWFQSSLLLIAVSLHVHSKNREKIELLPYPPELA